MQWRSGTSTHHPHSGVMILSASTNKGRPPETLTRRQYRSALGSYGASMNLQRVVRKYQWNENQTARTVEKYIA